jgi:hypothetical protein
MASQDIPVAPAAASDTPRSDRPNSAPKRPCTGSSGSSSSTGVDTALASFAAASAPPPRQKPNSHLDPTQVALLATLIDVRVVERNNSMDSCGHNLLQSFTNAVREVDEKHDQRYDELANELVQIRQFQTEDQCAQHDLQDNITEFKKMEERTTKFPSVSSISQMFPLDIIASSLLDNDELTNDEQNQLSEPKWPQA